MSYSEQATYGRKVVKGGYKKSQNVKKILYVSWGVCILIGFAIGVIFTWGINSLFKDEHVEPIDEIVSESTVEITPTHEPKIISLGEYKLTAYCSCEKCCGHWATVRPKDESGKPIVYTANGSIAKQGVTVAADTSVLPFGSVLLIDGHEYTVQDRGGAVKGNHVDIYFDNHQEALEFGVQHKEVFLKEGEK